MATKGTRKRRVFTSDCANPLFVKWVEELKNEAVEKNSKAQYTYSKALSSLRRYPLPLSSGQEAKLLDHIGEKLAKILDKKLAQYREEKGSEGEGQSCPQRGKKKKCKKENGPSNTDSSGVTSTPKSKRKKSCDQGFEYVPVYRSGPYAILIALHTAEHKPSWRGYLTKTELVREAQEYADSSFTVSEAGSYYTAWSSMSGLVERGLVTRYGHPPRFKLSDKGFSLAVRLLESGACQSHDTTPTHILQPSAIVGSGSKSTAKKEAIVQKSPSPQLNKIGATPVSSISPTHGEDHLSPHSHLGHRKRLKFWYVSAEGDHVMSKDKAAVIFNEELSVGFLVKCNREDLEESVFKYIIDRERSAEGDCVYAYISENGPDYSNPPHTHSHTSLPCPSATICETPLSDSKTSATAVKTTHPSIITLSDSDSDSSDDADLFRPLSERIGLSYKTTEELTSAAPPTHTLSSAQLNTVRLEYPVSPAQRAGMAAMQRVQRQDISSGNKQSTPDILNKEKNQEKSKSASSSVEIVDLTDNSTDVAVTAESAVTSKRVVSQELSAPEFVLRPGEFEIVLCVDSAESTASRKHSSQFRGLLLQELAKNGVQFDVRKLNVGDFLWVGREKVCPVSGQLSLPLSREVVLEYIVERKRMDDLAGSITDGRFKEQKFRLQSCGVSCPVYLVEEYRDMTHLSIPLSSLNQSLANTQVIDRFYVKRTKDIRESIAYLTIMTRQLHKHYADKTLEAFPHEAISGLLRAGHSQCVGTTVRCTPFKAFNEASIKNKVLSVYEMFGRQLMQLPGVSADKAAAVLKVYPTIASLRARYSECENTGEQAKLLSNIKAGKTNRRLGDSLSSLIYSLYWLGKDC